MTKLYHKIFFIIFLLILLSMFDNYQKISYIISFTIIFILTETMIKNIYYSLLISLIIFFLLLSITIQNNNQKLFFENFDDKNESSSDIKNDNNDETKTQDIQGNVILDNMVKTLSGQLDPIKLLDSDTNEKNDINDSDYEKVIDNAIKAEHNPSSIENKNASELSPFQAQQETFQLINTVQQLSETVKTLGPVLQEGKKVLDLYKHFKF